MWCKKCQQDVPGIGSATAAGFRCAQCGTETSTGDDTHVTHAQRIAESAESGLDLSAAKPPLSAATSFDAWQIDQGVRDLQARVGNFKQVRRRPVRRPDSSPRKLRMHGGHAGVPRPHPRRARRKERSSMLAWTVLALGLMAFTGGAVLLGWSFVEQRPELWKIGMPAAVAGQVGLLLGLVLQLERIWQSSRYAVRKLEQVDSQLHQLEQAATMLNVTHSSAAQAFYAHMADDANPQVLLADLKGQIDLLAMSMSKRSA